MKCAGDDAGGFSFINTSIESPVIYPIPAPRNSPKNRTPLSACRFAALRAKLSAVGTDQEDTVNKPADAMDLFRPRHDFFIGIDSDGCAFDTMEIKQKRCFTPNTIRVFGLQDIADAVRETAEFVNLYSRYRGTNRYPALVRTMEYLAARKDGAARGVPIPRMDALRRWIGEEPKLSRAALQLRVEKTGDAELRTVLAWSEAVDRSIAETVKSAPPFPWVRESLEAAATRADILVVSQTPLETLKREWADQGLDRLVRAIAGQEHGTKTEHLARSARGKYTPENILMIGDAQGDARAAQENGILFFPIVPGREAESWRRFRTEASERFFSGTYRGAYASARMEEFDAALPSTPPW
jgi:phosphoglycolate phosphatase-like HAD superfamily hydrolase